MPKTKKIADGQGITSSKLAFTKANSPLMRMRVLDMTFFLKSVQELLHKSTLLCTALYLIVHAAVLKMTMAYFQSVIDPWMASVAASLISGVQDTADRG